MHVNNKRNWYILAASVAALAVLSPMAWQGSVPGWEAQLFERINGAHPSDLLTWVARLLSDLTWLVVITALAVFLLWRGKRELGWNAGFLAGSAYVATWLLEHIVRRPRPAELDLTSDAVIRASQDGYGFTSGHVAVMTAVVLWIWPRANTWQRVVLGLLVLLEMWARVYLGVHMPLDVIGGVAMAIAVWAGLKLLPQSMRNKLHLK